MMHESINRRVIRAAYHTAPARNHIPLSMKPLIPHCVGSFQKRFFIHTPEYSEYDQKRVCWGGVNTATWECVAMLPQSVPGDLRSSVNALLSPASAASFSGAAVLSGALAPAAQASPAAPDNAHSMELNMETLRAAVEENGTQLAALFEQWDTDKNGTVDKEEFRKAITALGYSTCQSEIDGVFAKLDKNKSGSLDYKELKKGMKVGKGASARATANAKQLLQTRRSLEDEQRQRDAQLAEKSMREEQTMALLGEQQRELEETKRALEDKERACSEAHEEVQDLRTQLSRLQEDLEREVKQREREEERAGRLQEELAKSSQEKEEATRELGKTRRAIGQLERRVEQSDAAGGEHKRQLEETERRLQCSTGSLTRDPSHSYTLYSLLPTSSPLSSSEPRSIDRHRLRAAKGLPVLAVRASRRRR